jgi:hypothetical protein
MDDLLRKHLLAEEYSYVLCPTPDYNSYMSCQSSNHMSTSFHHESKDTQSSDSQYCDDSCTYKRTVIAILMGVHTTLFSRAIFLRELRAPSTRYTCILLFQDV